MKTEAVRLGVVTVLKGIPCACFQHLHPAEAIAIVQKWSDEHQPKTYASNFFEKFPNAEKGKRGVPGICRVNVYGRRHVGHCAYGCEACWNEVMPE